MQDNTENMNGSLKTALREVVVGGGLLMFELRSVVESAVRRSNAKPPTWIETRHQAYEALVGLVRNDEDLQEVLSDISSMLSDEALSA